MSINKKRLTLQEAKLPMEFHFQNVFKAKQNQIKQIE